MRYFIKNGVVIPVPEIWQALIPSLLENGYVETTRPEGEDEIDYDPAGKTDYTMLISSVSGRIPDGIYKNSTYALTDAANVIPGNIRANIRIAGVVGTLQQQSALSISDEYNSARGITLKYSFDGEPTSNTDQPGNPEGRSINKVVSNDVTIIDLTNAALPSSSEKWARRGHVFYLANGKSYEGTMTEYPDGIPATVNGTAPVTIHIDGYVSDVTISLDETSLANLKPENIKAGITILGVTGTHNPAGAPETTQKTLSTYSNYTISEMTLYRISELSNKTISTLSNIEIGNVKKMVGDLI